MNNLKNIEIELSIVIPCLNEDETLRVCIQKCQNVIDSEQLSAEIIIADNGSTDGSLQIAEEMGVRIVSVKEKGYGHALMTGMYASYGKYILMGDADDSYNFLEIPKYLKKILEGFDLVQGCRLPSGGGTVMQGAMPFLHRWLGNPMLTSLARLMFNVPIHDIYCGMRCFTKKLFIELDQKCTGMEFATENIIKSSLGSYKIAEVPITLHPDGRIKKTPHLRTFRDGWRTLRFFLMYCPNWLFFIPGLFLILLGAFGYALALPAIQIFGVTFDAHTLIFASLAWISGFQSIVFGVLTKKFAISEGLHPADASFLKWDARFSVETGLVVSIGLLFPAIYLLVYAILIWKGNSFGVLDYAITMRYVVPGMTLFVLGFQTMLFSFFSGILNIARK